MAMIGNRHSNAKIVLLVADKYAPDVLQSLTKLPRSVAVIGWDELLDGFAKSRYVRRLRADVHAIVDDPTSKRKQRYALFAAVSAAPPPDPAWKPRLEPSAGRLPAVLLDSPCGNVRAQLQVSVRADRTLWYTPGIGFTSGNTNGELTSLLNRVIGPLEAAERADQFEISRSLQGAGKVRAFAMGMSDRPWFSRGYALDYIGVKLKPRSSPTEALVELYGAFAVFEEIALQNGSRG